MVWLWVVDGCHGNPVSWTTINLIIKIINRASGCWLPDVIDNAGICGKSSNYIISLPASSSSIFLFFLTALRSEPAWQCPEDHKFKTKRSACVKKYIDWTSKWRMQMKRLVCITQKCKILFSGPVFKASLHLWLSFPLKTKWQINLSW